MVHHLLLQLGHLFAQHVGGGRQLRVLRLEGLHFILQPRDSLQLPFPAFGSSDAVSHSLSLGLDPLLALHVDRGQRRGLPRHLRHGLGLLFERREPWDLGGGRLPVNGELRRGSGKGHGRRRSGVVRRRDGADGRIVSVQVLVNWRVGAHGAIVAVNGGTGNRGHWRQRAVATGLGGRGDAHVRCARHVLVVELRQGSDKSLREALLLFRDVLGANKLGRSRRCGDESVAGLDDKSFQLRGGQFQQAHVGRCEELTGFCPEVRFQSACRVGEVQCHVVFQRFGVAVAVAGGVVLGESVQ